MFFRFGVSCVESVWEVFFLLMLLLFVELKMVLSLWVFRCRCCVRVVLSVYSSFDFFVVSIHAVRRKMKQ